MFAYADRSDLRYNLKDFIHFKSSRSRNDKAALILYPNQGEVEPETCYLGKCLALALVIKLAG